MTKTRVPRNFLLLDDLNNVKNFTHVTYGLMDEDENDQELRNNYATMKYWNCSLIYEGKNNDIKVFTATCVCSIAYPNEAPIIKFDKDSMVHNEVRKICDSDGNLIEPIIWNESMTLGKYLNAILARIGKKQ
jgi:ubiquitin-protein ligase